LKKEVDLLRFQIRDIQSKPDNADKVKEQSLIISDLQRIIEKENSQKKRFIDEIEELRQAYSE